MRSYDPEEGDFVDFATLDHWKAQDSEKDNRIEELEAENTTLRSMVEGVIADTGDDPEIMAASRAEWAARALEAEAKLAWAVGELEEMLMLQNSEAAYGILRVYTKSLLAELKGEADG
jgi:hypothetical protein